MSLSISKLTGYATLAAVSMSAPTAFAALSWQQVTNATSGGGTIYASSIAVTAANEPYILDSNTGGVFYLSSVSSGGFGNSLAWVRDGTITASFVGVEPDNLVFAFDDATSHYLADSSGVTFNQTFFAPQGQWAVQSTGGCLTSMGQIHYNGALIGAGCGFDAYGNAGLFTQAPLAAPWQQLPGAAIEMAVFTSSSNFLDQSLWTINQQGLVYAYDDSTNNWVEEPGWGVQLITDHAALGSDGIHMWDDSASDFISGQLVHGNWTTAVIGALPDGSAMTQIAYAPAASAQGEAFGGPSALWAIDRLGSVWTAGSPVR
ncbi:MAG: hypothetical protein FWD17_12145 [Polyangiaceae bacterium]|nr:hypothetical protein [Polyangiaceae bacterium]